MKLTDTQLLELTIAYPATIAHPQDLIQPLAKELLRLRRQIVVWEGAENDLRDEFAGQAMSGLMAADVALTMPETNIAKRAYEQADAMLEFRKGETDE